MAYVDLLKDPRWQRKRLETLNAAGWKGENCGDGTKCLNVHHKKYRRGAQPWEYEPDELEVLCEPCHVQATERLRRLDAVVASLKTLGDAGSLDQAIGYLAGLRALANVSGGDDRITVDSYEEAIGVGAAVYSTSAEDVLQRTKEGVFDVASMEKEIFSQIGKKVGG